MPDEFVTHIVNRFRANRDLAEAVCERYGVRALFFLQPDAIYNYPESLYRAPMPVRFSDSRKRRQIFYDRMHGAPGFINLTGLFESWGHNRKAVLDDLHYSPGFNEFLARRVADEIDIDALQAPAGGIAGWAPTGTPRQPGRTPEEAPY